MIQFISSHLNILLIARNKGNPVGWLRAHFLPRYDEKNTEILLHEIEVLLNYRQRGVATALVNDLKKIAKKNQASEIWVITNHSTVAAVKLYESTGAKAPANDDVVFVYQF